MPQVKIRISEQSDVEAQNESFQRPQVSKERIAVTSIFAQQVVRTGKSIVTYNLSNVGIRTGNYIAQEQINQAVEIIGDIASIGVGIAAGGPVGGLIAIAGITTKQIFSAISYEEDIRHQNINSAYLAERSGNTHKNGSRGTEN